MPVAISKACLDLRLNDNSGPEPFGAGGPRSNRMIASWARCVNVDDAPEESTFRNTDALRNYIPDQGTFTGDVHTFGGIDVALQLSEPPLHGRRYPPILAHCGQL
jgi:hypothetical protein